MFVSTPPFFAAVKSFLCGAFFPKLLLLALFLPTATVAAGEREGLAEARRLKIEAEEFIKRAGAGEPRFYAEALKLLYRAMDILENESHSAAAERLGEEVASATFWAKRFLPLNVTAPLRDAPPGESPSAPLAPPPPTPSTEKNVPVENALTAAEAEYRKAENFAATRADDPYAVALRWFQMAAQHSGTDWALKALAQARDAQARYRTQQAALTEKAVEPATPAERLIGDGDKLLAEKKYDQAFAKFSESRQLHESADVRRRLGHAHYQKGLFLRDEYSRRYLPAYNEYLAARDARAKQAALSRLRAIQQSLHGTANQCLKAFADMRENFQVALRLSGGKDLESAGHVALSYVIDPQTQTRARQLLSDFLSQYVPQNDEERTLYSYCETELARLKRMGR
jgi:hypothetical protein